MSDDTTNTDETDGTQNSQDTYLDEALVEIPTDAERAALYVVTETGIVTANLYDAHEYAVRRYRRDNRYSGPVHHVTEEVDDGFEVMVMEDSIPEGER